MATWPPKLPNWPYPPVSPGHKGRRVPGPFSATSGLNRPPPKAAGPPGRPICSSRISHVFGVSLLCIPIAALSVAKSGFFLGSWCCVHNNPRFQTRNPRILQPAQPWKFVQSFGNSFGTSLKILGLNFTKRPLPRSIYNPRIAGLES